ncbi:hypothetical protein BACCAP_00185 [Pseudoflavonifractor capillosus ATCC 29799]|uniref:Uncharacterized protein n=1 Tax=Pseudoflavonifractor capillosus ATCC 29799 TaxID=411467 RepID=A6NPS0_9FIRM|nr:hypothetical protein BACCAP_00185 [Pseudoflavonifractor capillosus ATCC 29799]
MVSTSIASTIHPRIRAMFISLFSPIPDFIRSILSHFFLQVK